jgi:hypothetical protein
LTTVQSFQRKRPSRKPFPDHLPRRISEALAPRQQYPEVLREMAA